jgi:ketosteroid isomerase-like protein
VGERRAASLEVARTRRGWQTAGMASELSERLREASSAFNEGDTTPLVALLHDDLEWRGAPRGHLWWKRTPA